MTLENGTHALESDRLVLRRITADDFEFFARIHSDAEVARYIGHGRPRTSAETRAWLDAILTTYATLSENSRSERLAVACGARRESSVEFFERQFDVFGWPSPPM